MFVRGHRLFFPLFGPFLSKAADALNEAPLFIDDKSCKRALEKADEAHQSFLSERPSRSKEGLFKDKVKQVMLANKVTKQFQDIVASKTVKILNNKSLDRKFTVLKEDEEKLVANSSPPDQEPDKNEKAREYRQPPELPLFLRRTPSTRRGKYNRRQPVKFAICDWKRFGDGRNLPNAKPVAKEESDRHAAFKDYGSLPLGWMRVPSLDFPGEILYQNSELGFVSHRHPLDPAYVKWEKHKKRNARKRVDTERKVAEAERRQLTLLASIESRASADSNLTEMAERDHGPFRDYGLLPLGWMRVPSRSLPGEIEYENTELGILSHRHPLDPIYKRREKEIKRKVRKDEAEKKKLALLVSRRSSSSKAKLTEVELDHRQFRDYGPLPAGWVRIPSRDIAGEFVYKNPELGKESHRHPLDPASSETRSSAFMHYFKSMFGSWRGNVLRSTPSESSMILRDNDTKQRTVNFDLEASRRKRTESASASNRTALSHGSESMQSTVSTSLKNIESDGVWDSSRSTAIVPRMGTHSDTSSDSDKEGDADRSVADNDDLDPGIYVLPFVAWEEQRNKHFRETRYYWIIEIERPRDERAHGGEGMLVWFSKDSTIGSAGSVADETDTFVRFFEYRKDKSAGESMHGEAIPAVQAHFMYELLMPAIQYGSKYSGRPGESLPSRDQPLFIPKQSAPGTGDDYFTCAVCLDVTYGTTPNFELCACYTPDTPLVGMEADLRRRLCWLLYVSMYLSTTTIVLAHEYYQKWAIIVFIIASLVLAMVSAEAKYVEHKEAYGGSFMHALDFIAHYSSVRIILSAILSRCSVTPSRWFGSWTHRPNMIQPILGPPTRKSKKTKPPIPSITPSDEDEQLNICKNMILSTTSTAQGDQLIAGLVKQWRKTNYRHSAVEGSVMISEALRGLLSPAAIRKIIVDVKGRGRVILRANEAVIARRVSALYYEVLRRQENKRYYRDVIHGPANGLGVSAYKRFLHRVPEKKVEGISCEPAGYAKRLAKTPSKK